MILYRIREYGSGEWTDLSIDGELEESVAEALVGALEGAEHVHIQRRVEGEWEDV